ncbi:uncharacterized protein LOC135393456 [Ornithodoros turicata]|uniref:uncharacterized protein LOC135393456 n=1 Tax=Ornithodoros turicata TaxID=34597 RepID=UPI003139C619
MANVFLLGVCISLLMILKVNAHKEFPHQINVFVTPDYRRSTRRSVLQPRTLFERPLVPVAQPQGNMPATVYPGRAFLLRYSQFVDPYYPYTAVSPQLQPQRRFATQAIPPVNPQAGFSAQASNYDFLRRYSTMVDPSYPHSPVSPPPSPQGRLATPPLPVQQQQTPGSAHYEFFREYSKLVDSQSHQYPAAVPQPQARQLHEGQFVTPQPPRVNSVLAYNYDFLRRYSELVDPSYPYSPVGRPPHPEGRPATPTVPVLQQEAPGSARYEFFREYSKLVDPFSHQSPAAVPQPQARQLHERQFVAPQPPRVNRAMLNPNYGFLQQYSRHVQPGYQYPPAQPLSQRQRQLGQPRQWPSQAPYPYSRAPTYQWPPQTPLQPHPAQVPLPAQPFPVFMPQQPQQFPTPQYPIQAPMPPYPSQFYMPTYPQQSVHPPLFPQHPQPPQLPHYPPATRGPSRPDCLTDDPELFCYAFCKYAYNSPGWCNRKENKCACARYRKLHQKHAEVGHPNK